MSPEARAHWAEQFTVEAMRRRSEELARLGVAWDAAGTGDLITARQCRAAAQLCSPEQLLQLDRVSLRRHSTLAARALVGRAQRIDRLRRTQATPSPTATPAAPAAFARGKARSTAAAVHAADPQHLDRAAHRSRVHTGARADGVGGRSARPAVHTSDTAAVVLCGSLSVGDLVSVVAHVSTAARHDAFRTAPNPARLVPARGSVHESTGGIRCLGATTRDAGSGALRRARAVIDRSSTG